MVTAIFLLSCLAPFAAAEGNDAVMTVHRMEIETADRIQSRILDPILGPGQSSVFIKLEVEARIRERSSDKSGEGVMHTSSSTAKSNPVEGSSESTMRQEAKQGKLETERFDALSLKYSTFKVVILHDAKAPAKKLKLARETIVAAYDLEPTASIRFIPADFVRTK